MLKCHMYCVTAVPFLASLENIFVCDLAMSSESSSEGFSEEKIGSPPGSPEIPLKPRPSRQKSVPNKLKNTDVQLEEIHVDPNRSVLS